MSPTWLTVLAWVSLAAAGASALDILIDIYVRRYRQHMRIMEAVWPVTALYFGPVAWLAYRRWGRLNSPRYQREARAEPNYGEPVSVGIFLKRAQTFAQLRPKDRWVAMSFSLPRKVQHDRIVRKVMQYHGRYWHVANLRSPADLDDRLCAWLTEAYLNSPV